MYTVKRNFTDHKMYDDKTNSWRPVAKIGSIDPTRALEQQMFRIKIAHKISVH